MPFTPNRKFKANPRFIVAAEGMYYTASDGRRIIDGTSGLWCVNAGHGRSEIIEAIKTQAAELDYVPSYMMGHPKSFQLAQRLAAMAPGDLNHVFFGNSGSEAVDTALKIALAYHARAGEPQRRRLVGRARGFHGAGFGGISVGGIAPNRTNFGSLLAEVDHLGHTHNPEHNAFTLGQPEWGAHLADELEDIVALHGAGNFAAVIIEPMAGAGGVLIPPKGYLEKMRQICDAHGILLIFDEVITGFGRLGAGFAAERFKVVPDIMTIAKGLTNGAVPMGAALVTSKIYDAFMEGPENVAELYHGYTYSGHPVASAAALATLDIYARDHLFERAAGIENFWQAAVHGLKGLPNVIDIRNLGLVAGIELAAKDGAPGTRGADILAKCFKGGALVRATGDTIALAPPLIITEEQIEALMEIVAAALKSVD
ncbi:MAG: aspartate aminotransferase family protein [Rhodospirillales bacterium]|nr:aspartate aminotransferase family protein [Rhodospirillales bacterium]